MLLLLQGYGVAAPPSPDAAGLIYAEIDNVYMIHTDIEPIDTLTESAATHQVYTED